MVNHRARPPILPSYARWPWGGPDSVINSSIVFSDGSHEVSVSGPESVEWADWTYSYAPGEGMIFDINGDPIGPAVDHLIEAVDHTWITGDIHSMEFAVTPNRPGELYVRVRVTMRDGISGPFINDTSAAGGELYFPGQNGWEVRQYTVVVEPNPSDIDGDGDIDLDDHAAVVECLQGPSSAPEPGCEDADINADGSIDLLDFALIQDAFSGQL